MSAAGARLGAAEFLDWLDAPAGLAWLDVGCGTGALRERLRESLPREPDGSISLVARAWAVPGRKL